MDEFKAPSGDWDAGSEVGEIDVLAAFTTAISAALRNALGWIGVFFAGGAFYLLGFCTCIGWLVTAPLYFWGMYRFSVDAIDDRATVAGFFTDGFARFGQAVGYTWGFFLLMVLAFLPLVGAYIGLSAATTPDVPLGEIAVQPLWVGVVSQLLVGSWSFVICRFYLAPFYMLDQDLGPLDAMGAAWADTDGQWLRVMGIAMIGFVLGLPGSAITVYSNHMLSSAIAENPSDPMILLESMGSFYGLLAVVLLFSSIAGVISISTYAAAYRQLHPLMDEEA